MSDKKMKLVFSEQDVRNKKYFCISITDGSKDILVSKTTNKLTVFPRTEKVLDSLLDQFYKLKENILKENKNE